MMSATPEDPSISGCFPSFTLIGIAHSMEECDSLLAVLANWPEVEGALMVRSRDHDPRRVRELVLPLRERDIPSNCTLIPNNLRYPGLTWTHVPAHRLQLNPRIEGCFGTSIHSLDEMKRANLGGAAYGVVSLVNSTESKPDRAPLGVRTIRQIVQSSTIPLFGLGGIVEPGDAVSVMNAGMQGCAVASLTRPANQERLAELVQFIAGRTRETKFTRNKNATRAS
jgi:hypothetical protein